MIGARRESVVAFVALVACKSDAPIAHAHTSATASATMSASASATASGPLAGVITDLADAPKPSFGVALDDAYVYWAVYEGGDIFRVARTGGVPVQLARGQDFVNAIAVARNGDVYWSIGHGRVPGGTIKRLEKGASAPTDFAPNQADAASVAVDATHVYWIVRGGFDGGGNVANPEIRRKARAGGISETIATNIGDASRLVLDGDDVVFINGSAPVVGSVVKVAKRGGSLTVLASSQMYPRGLSVDGGYVYWSVSGPLEIASRGMCPNNTPCPVPTVVPVAAHGEVRRVPRNGGEVQVLATNLNDVGMVAAFGGDVFFSAKNGTFMMLSSGSDPKKISTSWSSEMSFANGTGYAQLGGKIVALN